MERKIMLKRQVSYITASGDELTTEELVQYYRNEVRKTPNPSLARLKRRPNALGSNVSPKNKAGTADYPLPAKSVYQLDVKWNVRDVDQLEMTPYRRVYNVVAERKNDQASLLGSVQVDSVTDFMDASMELTSCASADDRFKAVLVKGTKKNEAGEPKVYLEVLLNGIVKVRRFDIDKLEDCGKIYPNGQFGAFEWSPVNSPDEIPKLLFVAEKKEPQKESYFANGETKANVKPKEDSKTPSKDKQPVEQEEVDSGTDQDSKKKKTGNQFEYQEDWGEALDGIKHPTVCILELIDLEKGTFRIKSIDMPGMSLGQAFWINEKTIGFIGWQEEPRRLGVTYCTNRPSALYACVIDNETLKPELLDDGAGLVNLRCPQINNSRTAIYYFERDSFGPHYDTSNLIKYDLKEGKRQLVIAAGGTKDTLPSEGSLGSNLYGIYADELPERAFSITDQHLFFDSLDVIHNRLMAANLLSGKVEVIKTPCDCVFAKYVLDDILVIVGSSVGRKPNVYLAWFDAQEPNWDALEWVKADESIPDEIPRMKCETSVIECSDGSGGKIYTALIGMEDHFDAPTPTAIIPHGGPHSALFVGFFLYPTLFAKLGLKTLFINYRGSIGLGRNYAHMLCGHCGEMDVQDCVDAIKHHISKNQIDPQNMILFGGSHGGFLIAHLSGQHADMDFAACVARNPVIDVAGMLEGTDIPDWCWTETILGHQFDFKSSPTSEQLAKMLESSPISHVDKVKVPTLMMLGSKDRRVPKTQGLKWYYALKARGQAPTKCYIYEDKHDLQKVDVDSDVFINAATWILKYLRH